MGEKTSNRNSHFWFWGTAANFKDLFYFLCIWVFLRANICAHLVPMKFRRGHQIFGDGMNLLCRLWEPRLGLKGIASTSNHEPSFHLLILTKVMIMDFVFVLFVNLHINRELPIYSVICRTTKERTSERIFHMFLLFLIHWAFALYSHYQYFLLLPSFSSIVFRKQNKISKLPHRLLNSYRAGVCICFVFAIFTLVVDF